MRKKEANLDYWLNNPLIKKVECAIEFFINEPVISGDSFEIRMDIYNAIKKAYSQQVGNDYELLKKYWGSISGKNFEADFKNVEFDEDGMYGFKYVYAIGE